MSSPSGTADPTADDVNPAPAPADAPAAAASDETAGDCGALGIVITLCLGGLVASLMQTLIIPVQPELPQLLHTSISNASWVITATLLGGAVAMPIAGRLGDMYGKQRVILASALLLVVGSLICAIGGTLVPMLIGRAVQGMSMGFIPVGISLMREVTPPRLTSMAVAAMSATLGVGGAIGLPVSAWVAQTWDWRALFWASAGLALLITVLVVVIVPNVADSAGGRLDVVGAVGMAAGLCSVLIAISKGKDWGWASGATLGFLAAGVVVLLAWAMFELRHSDPLVDLRTTAKPTVLLTNLAAIAIGFGMMAQAIVVPTMLEVPDSVGGFGQTILQTGLWMAPGGIMMMLFAPISGMLINRLGPKLTLAIGGAVLCVGYLTAYFLMNAPWQLAVASVIGSAGVGIGYAAMPTLIMGAVPITEAGAAVGLNGLMRSVGTTLSSAVMAVVLAASTIDLGGGHQVPTHSAFRWCFLIGAAAAFVGVLITLAIPRARARSAELAVA
ncbi:MFS transporter permease [Gordonia sp. QH-12]|uniref:MFS transporter n=1 Tax=Gordonia TaxID=2053 RepID=UPI000782F4A4|nr:MFS transporter [Gordonia sp. QH-12]KXT56361.1 MFS transporter permease [Gordonia sp. QH-12]